MQKRKKGCGISASSFNKAHGHVHVPTETSMVCLGTVSTILH